PIHDVGEIDGRPYYTMRYVEGFSLEDLIKKGSVAPSRAAAYVEQAARGVAEAHRHGILHRDIKPHNLLVEARTDRVYVADFGLAKLVPRDRLMSRSGVMTDTPFYIAPEQVLANRPPESNASVTATGEAKGTASFMSPEAALDSSRVTTATDV